MKIFTLKNLTDRAGAFDRVPWDFKFASETISAEVRKNKVKRQAWCTDPSVEHCFYSAFIGVAESGRVNKENPPKLLWLFVADYDCVISDERMKEAIEQMPIKPTYIETSIGGNRRLIWVLEEPILLGSNEFATFLLQKAETWLRLNQLPMLDQPAFITTTRLFCCGDKWEPTGYGPVPLAKSQTFFCDCGKEYRFRSYDEILIPLDVAAAEFAKKYPETFSKWPGEFVLGSQGPSFWVPGSESAGSAIVKTEGIFTFAAHAEKAFFTWGDLLGQDFVKQYRDTAIARASHDIWWDNLKFHRKIDGEYVSMTKEIFVNYLRVDCGLSEKADSSGTSPIAQTIQHIYNHQRVAGAAPHVPLPTGIIYSQGKRCLNTYTGRVVEPATGVHHWGDLGMFPWISRMIDTLLYPKLQKEYLLAWYKYYYQGMRKKLCRPGQILIIQGQAGCGKSLLSREIIGRSVGGFCDPSSFVLNGSNFNSELFEIPHWALDDDAPSASQHAAGGAHATMKKLVANDFFMYSKKYEVPSMVQRGGRLIATINPDVISLKLIPSLDDGMHQKFSLFRCADFGPEKDNFTFPMDREEIQRIIERELPYFLAWLEAWEVPDHISRGDGRFGFAAYHDPSMAETSKQAGSAAPFKEILLETLIEHFRQNPEDTTWTGSSNRVMHLLENDIRNQLALRSYKPEKINSNLETLSKENFLGLTTSSDPSTGIRLWTFKKPTA